MHITLYKSALCPRCHLARKYLHELCGADPDLTLAEVDVLAAPKSSWLAGVRMIPAIRINDKLLSAIFLRKNDIAAFIARNRS